VLFLRKLKTRGANLKKKVAEKKRGQTIGLIKEMDKREGTSEGAAGKKLKVWGGLDSPQRI